MYVDETCLWMGMILYNCGGGLSKWMNGLSQIIGRLSRFCVDIRG